MALDVFIERIGITPSTAWRWRKSGMLQTININGRQYVPAKEILKFNRRAAAGEFEKEHKTPQPAKPVRAGALRPAKRAA